MRKFLALVLLFVAGPAWASYSCDGANDKLIGSFTSTYASPVTIAGWVKAANHPAAADVILNFGISSSSANESVSLRTTVTDDIWAGGSTNSAGATIAAATGTNNIDDTWTPFVAVKTNDTLLDAYLINIATTGQNTNSNVVSGSLKHISVCENLAATGDFAGLVAEISIWDRALNATEIGDYMDGVAASSIGASDLIGYYPLSAENATQSNLGVDATGDLTVTGAVFNADHPTISSAADPDWDTPPSVLSQTDTAYTIQYDANADADDIFCGLYAKDATTPTEAEVIAGTGDRAQATEASTGASDSIVLTAPEDPPWYIGDIYCVLKADTNETSAIADGDLLDEVLDIPANKQRLTLTSVHATSPYSGQGVEIGDTCTIDTVSDPGAYAVTDELDGTVSYAAGGDTSRQLIESYCYDVDSPANLDFLLVYNNQAPQALEPFFEDALYELGANPAADLAAGSEDPELDDIDWTVTTGALPTDWALDSETGLITDGDPGACGSYSHTITLTDTYGATSAVPGTVDIGPEIPDVQGLDEAATITAIETTAPCDLDAVAGATVHHPTIEAGKVVSTDPAIGTVVVEDQVVTYFISSGPGPSRRTRLGLGLGIN